MKICPSCHAKVDDEFQFCLECGTPVPAPQQQNAPAPKPAPESTPAPAPAPAPTPAPKKSGKGLIVLISVLGALVAVLLVVVILFLAGVFDSSDDKKGSKRDDTEDVDDDEDEDDEDDGPQICDHVLGEWEIDTVATCVQEGARHISCTNCGVVMKTENIPTTAHTESDWIIETAATSKEEGLKYKECLVCNQRLSTEVITPTGPMSDEDIAKYIQERTVAIVINGEISGTGFFIDSDGTLVTCFHVVENAFYPSAGTTASIAVTLENKATYSLEYVVAFDYAYDLAVLKIDTQGAEVPYFQMNTDTLPNNSKVYAYGYALGMSTANFTSGNISQTSHKYGLADAYLSSAPISGGNSGGPLVNAYGEVVGINAASYIYGNNMYIAVKISQIDLLRVRGNKTFSEFVQWHNMETRDSLNMWITSGTESDFTTYYYYSYISTYHDITGASCQYSSNYFLEDYYTVSGYDSQKYYYTYYYDKNQYNAYVEYLKGEGYVYDEEYSGSYSGDIFIDYYYSEVDGTNIKFVVFTDAYTGRRMVQINTFLFE